METVPSQQSTPPKMPLLLSALLPGLGQAYYGHVFGGMIISNLWILSVFMFLIGIVPILHGYFHPMTILFCIFAPGLWAGALLQANAERKRGILPVTSQQKAAWTGVALFSFLMSATALLLFPILFIY